MAYNNNVYAPYNPYAFGAQPIQTYPPYVPPQQPMVSQMAQQQAVQQPVQQQSQQPVQSQQSTQTQGGYSYTNEIFVTSKEDALNRQVPFNSSVTYLHQDKPFGFQVVTDAQGKKTVNSFRIVECSDEELKDETTTVAKADLSIYATKDDLNAGLLNLEDKIKQYFKSSTAVPKKKKVVVEDDEDEE